MANWLQRIIYGESMSLDLKKETSYGTSRIVTPMIPPLDTSYDSLLKYTRRNELVYACIEKKAQAACDAELFVERKNGEGEWERVKEMHPMITLLNKPNPYDDGEGFRRSWIASEAFADCFYAEIVKSNGGQVVGLYPLHPAYIRPDYEYSHGGVRLKRYIYTIDGYEVFFKPEDLLIRRRHSLHSVYSSLSAVQVALGSVDADTALTDYIRAFFNNGATPSGVLAMAGRNLTQEEALAVQQSWMSKYSRGGINRGGPAVLPEGTTYTPVGSGMDELDSESITSKIESRICMAFGVPPILVGAYVGLLHVNQRASVREAQQDFWMNTMSPELKSLRSFLTWNLLPMFENSIDPIRNGELRVNWDMTQVEALQDDLDDVHTRIGGGYKAGIYTLNEARQEVGLPPVDDEVGNQFYSAPALLAPEENAPSPKQLNKADILDAVTIEPLEKKTFDFNGLALSREPSELEQLIDIKKIDEDQKTEQEKLLAVLLALRESLIDSAVISFDLIEEISNLSLTPPTSVYKKVKKILERAYANGQMQVVGELRSQGAPVDLSSVEPEIDEITDLTVSRVVAAVQSSTINQVVAYGIAGVLVNEIRGLLGPSLRDQSEASINSFSASAVNASVQRGRDAEMAKHENLTYIYSGILDSAICDPCEAWDGEQRENREDLPSVPNVMCEGRDRCRCVVIAVYGGETFEAFENEVR